MMIGNKTILSSTIGLVYLWFGSLKFFPGTSPAEELARNTIHQLTFGLVTDQAAVTLLAILEVGIGLLLLIGIFRKQVVVIALAHMVFTFTPLLFFPNDSFAHAPLVPTLLGQYIGKNIIIIGALVTMIRKEKNKGFFI
ncbi:doxx family protein [Muricauda sp. SCSIO 64092]|uniref:doxx family protein n=1 Tax=Allomuricauda sp. SCSIO 64092 TaxID=2908842 RepID=UPI001FF41E6C|nr:doxx family protein [Muricauda sp. SCSIO 64092]UOY07961.1 doxx family protein [Muricauda sp. SCSIO 64092]